MIKHFSLSIIFSAVLVGCGGSSSSSNDVDEQGTSNIPVTTSAPLDSMFYGVWSIDTLAYAAISKDTITLFAFDENRGCYESGLFKVDSSTETSLTSTDIQTGEQSTSNFEMSGDQLIVEEDGLALSFTEAGYFNPSPGCESFYGVTNIEIDLELSYLPPYVMINRDAQSTGRVEYDYGINFDINNNDMIDSGDISIRVRHFKGSGDYPNNHHISVAELGGNIWTHLPKQQSDIIISRSSSDDNNIVQVTQTDNILTFNFDITQHPLLAHINEDTPVQINTSLSYPEPESDVIDSWQDGPWNWSSEKHKDYLPEEGFLQPNFYTEMLIDDATIDLTEGESMWVDIKSVQFKFTK
ncbi:hypothetical protein [Colwellia sp. E150_009]